MSVPAIKEVVSTTATTQLDPITALATLDGHYQAMEMPAQVCMHEIYCNYYFNMCRHQ